MAVNPEEALAHWGDDARIQTKVSGGNRSEVWAVEINGQRHVLRKSRRAPEALAWELDLLAFLGSHRIGVPTVVPTARGERTAGEYFVQSWVDGHPPQTAAEWHDVAETLTEVHRLTRDWPQRPTFASTADLLNTDRGGDVDLTAMPPDVVRLCRDAWRALSDAPTSAIHGDPLGNVLVGNAGVVLIDWDECRVDASILDLAELPIEGVSTPAARKAAAAWEVAAAWMLEPDYARRRLAELS